MSDHALVSTKRNNSGAKAFDYIHTFKLCMKCSPKHSESSNQNPELGGDVCIAMADSH